MKVASVLDGASIAYLAVETSSGPHVTPLLFAATPDRLWFGIGRGTLKARVPAAPLRDAGGLRTAAACVCIDESEGPGPLAKRGRLLRGQGHAKLRGDIASVTLETKRVTSWKGFQTQTAAAAAR